MKSYYTALLALGICGIAVTLEAQEVSRGSVTDATTGTPLIGATVRVVGTDGGGTLTDLDGNYYIEITPPQDLQFSYVGYTNITKTVTAGGAWLNVALPPGQDLDAAVVIGYGTVKKGDLTGSVAAVDEDQFNDGAIVAPTALIAGKVAGVQVATNTGEPGAGPVVRIRGGTSINASNDPLYVVDGVPLDNTGFRGGRSPLNFVNPNDVATMTVLKDASATAIYGSRGANGVILITTKRGLADQPARISYDGSFTASTVGGSTPTLDADAFRNAVAFYAPNRVEELGEASTDWFDEVTRTGLGHAHNLAVSGGGGGMTYRMSGGYQLLEGVVRGSQTERTTVAVNLQQRLFDERLTLAFNFKGALTKDRFDPGVIGVAQFFDPTQPVYDTSNTAFAGYFEYGTGLAPRNPVSSLEQISNRGRAVRGLGNAELTYDLRDVVPGLKFRVNGGFDALSNRQNEYRPTTYATLATDGFSGEAWVRTGQRYNKLLETYLTYDLGDGPHAVALTAGYSYQDFTGESPEFRAFNFENDLFGSNSTVAATEFRSTNSTSENRLISVFGRANYTYDERILLTGTLRRDGSTRFGPGNRWGLFPSAAVAWRVLEEDFAEGLRSVVSDLKLRVGWGVTGNQDFGNFLYLPRYQLSDVTTRFPLFADRFVTTARPNGYDAGLKWEQTQSTNVGLDFGFLDGRFAGTVEYYHKRTDDLLFTVNVPAGTNLTDRVLTNIGSVRNAGLELSLNGLVFNTEDFRWELGGNVSRNTNEVLAIDGSASADIQTGTIAGGVGNTVQIIRVGEAVNSYYLYDHLLDAGGAIRRDDTDYNEDGAVDALDLYADLNGDGVINTTDLRVVGQAAPKILYGITSQFGYKAFDLSLTLRGASGNRVYNNNASVNGYLDNLSTVTSNLGNLHESALVTGFTRPQFFSDYYLESGAFLRLDNATLSYRAPRLAGVLDASVYVTGQNLFVLTEYGGTDPEVGGIDDGLYPRPRTFIAGIRLGL